MGTERRPNRDRTRLLGFSRALRAALNCSLGALGQRARFVSATFRPLKECGTTS